MALILSFAPPRGRILAADYFCNLGGYTTRLSAKIKPKETTDGERASAFD